MHNGEFCGDNSEVCEASQSSCATLVSQMFIEAVYLMCNIHVCTTDIHKHAITSTHEVMYYQ